MLYVIRHGRTDWNAEQRLQGQAEREIDETGREQAARNGRRLAALLDDPQDWTFVASPMLRTRQTMEIIRGQLGLPKTGYVTDRRLVEVHFGEWQGRTYAEIDADSPGTTARRETDKWTFVPPGRAAESYSMLAERVKPWLDSVSGPTVLVTHGGVVRALMVLAGLSDGPTVAAMEIPQDRFLRIASGKGKWL